MHMCQAVHVYTMCVQWSYNSITHLPLLCYPEVFKTPAPGAYYPEQVHPQGEIHAPAYSMSARTKNSRSELCTNIIFVRLQTCTCIILCNSECIHRNICKYNSYSFSPCEQRTTLPLPIRTSSLPSLDLKSQTSLPQLPTQCPTGQILAASQKTLLKPLVLATTMLWQLIST